MNRRGLLRGILAAGMAPVVVKAEILMPVRKIIVPENLLMRGEIGTIDGFRFYQSPPRGFNKSNAGLFVPAVWSAKLAEKFASASAFGSSVGKSWTDPAWVPASQYVSVRNRLL